MAKNTKKSSSSSGEKSRLSLNKVSFWLIVVTAVLYLVAIILSAVHLNPAIVGALQGIATACIIVVVSILAWRFVAKKPVVWKVLYIICLLVVILGIVIPLVL